MGALAQVSGGEGVLEGHRMTAPARFSKPVSPHRAPHPLLGRLLIPPVIFALVVTVLMIVRWPTIQAATYENGDMAANSLLVQDAKSFHLLVGNYSRVGFNHPGPALLYVLAAGEALFHDALHWTRTPMGGQMAGTVVFSSVWIAALWPIVRRGAGTMSAAAMGLAAFVAATAFLIPAAFVWIWPPDLYYFPFAAFTLALSELARGRADSLLTLAVSWGFLLNGHICFFAVTAIMFAVVLVANRRLSRGLTQPPPCILSGSFFRRSPVRIVLALLILGLFLLPLVLQTVLHYPGPLPEYMKYSHQHRANGPVPSLEFVAFYWGGVTLFAAGMAALAFIHRRERRRAADRPLVGLGVALLAATVAVFAYAVVGVDDTKASYIGRFYETVPAWLAAMAALFAAERVTWLRLHARAAAALVVLACAALTGWRVSSVPPNDCNPAVPDLYAGMKRLGRFPLLVVLDNTTLDGNEWGEIWSHMVAVENYAKRRGELPFLITKNWQILFTPRARYTGPALPPDRFLVSSANRPGAELRANDLSFYRIKPAIFPVGEPFRIAQHRNETVVNLLGEGWSSPEDEFVWSETKEAHLYLRLPTPPPAAIALDLGAYLPGSRSQHAEVTVNGVSLGDAFFTPAANHAVRTFKLPAGLGQVVDLAITVDHPYSPCDFEFSTDTRTLGVSFYGLELLPASPAATGK